MIVNPNPKHMSIENLAGQFVNVVVTLENGKAGKKLLKVCKVKARSILFIEVDRPNRKNIFRKVSRKDIMNVVNDDTSGNNVNSVYIRKGVLLSQNKWESSWDSVGQFSPMVQKNFGRPAFSNHSKGWAPKLPSTTNNPVSGFPMI
jgi:hypothetical protein